MSERQSRNEAVIAEFRAHQGVVGGDFTGVPLLLLTTVGARTGLARTTPLTYLADGERLVVFAANGGRPAHPGWYRNLMASPPARVEVGDRTCDVTASVAAGAAREELWRRQLRRTPYFAGFQERAGRRVPVVVLTPVGPDRAVGAAGPTV